MERRRDAGRVWPGTCPLPPRHGHHGDCVYLYWRRVHTQTKQHWPDVSTSEVNGPN